jgi:hypothetical protein
VRMCVYTRVPSRVFSQNLSKTKSMVASSSKHFPHLYGWNSELVLSPQGIPSIVVDEFFKLISSITWILLCWQALIHTNYGFSLCSYPYFLCFGLHASPKAALTSYLVTSTTNYDPFRYLHSLWFAHPTFGLVHKN